MKDIQFNVTEFQNRHHLYDYILSVAFIWTASTLRWFKPLNCPSRSTPAGHVPFVAHTNATAPRTPTLSHTIFLVCHGGRPLSTCGKFLLYKLLVFVNATFDAAYFEVSADPDLVTDEADQTFIVGHYYHSTLQPHSIQQQ